MRTYLLNFLLIFVFIFFSCKDENISMNNPDKQIRFNLSSNINFNYLTTSSDTLICTSRDYIYGIHQFNIENYSGVNSAVLVVYDITTRDLLGNDITKTAKIELYDLTNKVPIANSMIVSDNTPVGNFVSSSNILDSFPKQTIDIGVRIIFDKKQQAFFGAMYLFLYRN